MQSKVTLFFTFVSSSLEMKKHQQNIQIMLEAKQIPYEIKDISYTEEDKEKMREISNNPTAVPPQIANGDQYCGDYAAFCEAVEQDRLEEFLKLV